MNKGSSSSSGSSSGSRKSDGSTSTPTTPNSEEDQQVKLPSSDDDISAEYNDQLPPLPKAWQEGLEPLAIDSSTPDAWVPRDERM